MEPQFDGMYVRPSLLQLLLSTTLKTFIGDGLSKTICYGFAFWGVRLSTVHIIIFRDFSLAAFLLRDLV